MKKNALRFGLLSVVLIGFASCKDEKEAAAEKKVETYIVYVDSINNVESDSIKANWDAVDMEYQARSADVDAALLDMKNSEKEQERIRVSRAKYNELKASMEANRAAEKAAAEPANPKQLLRDRLFGAGKIGDDMNFSWVNKDNILDVYDAFFQAYKDNKGDFSREDYDEVKLMYEALDSRKNTVEKEGLSAEDNNKIASIKFKFAPMFKLNRIGAKSRENKEAKE